jgi:plastocyanin
MVVVLPVIASCGHTYQAAKPPTITLDATTKLFTPFITTISAGTTVDFTNADSVPHDVKSVPTEDPQAESSFVNLITIDQSLAAGQTFAQTFTAPGLYDVYDDTQATIDPIYHRVMANKDNPGFPFAPEAVIWVKGGIAGFIPSNKNTVISGQDDFQYKFNAVQSGSPVTWHNYDSDDHYVTDPGAFRTVNPADFGDGTNDINGTVNAPPMGGDVTLTFYVPGLYYYYCTAHADFDPALDRAKPHDDASIYPEVMEGFVLVLL